MYRFGEESLHSCEVILHDLEESRRMNALLGQELQKETPSDGSEQFLIDYLLISDNYWPPLNDRLGNPIQINCGGDIGEVKHHAAIENRIKQFSETFELLKKPRKFHPLSELGQTDLELNFDDGSTRSFTVTPVQASLIMYVADSSKASTTSQDLARLMCLEEAEVRKMMGYWVSKSVVSVRLDSKSGTMTLYYAVTVYIYHRISIQARASKCIKLLRNKRTME